MSDWDLIITDANIATLSRAAEGYDIVENAAIGIRDGNIQWIGPATALPQVHITGKHKDTGSFTCVHSANGRWLTPALIDCHTHLVFAGDRAAEFELRRNGASYEDIARTGGGINSTVTATRAAKLDALVSGAQRRLQSLLREGVATIEIKSGYGLNCATEVMMLNAARLLGASSGASILTTFLGAHAVPPEFSGRKDDYIDFVVNEMLPQVHELGLADSVDAFCENIAFSTNQVARVFDKAKQLGIPVKLHADQLSDSGGAALAASFNALSADHLEYTTDTGVRAMADAGTVAVMLPGAFLTLRETQRPPIESFRHHAVPMAIATDCNPGSSPLCSLRMAMSLAVAQFELTPVEALAGVTREAARALGLDDRGTLEVGKRADIVEWDIGHPRELAYWMGLNQLERLYVAGKVQTPEKWNMDR